MKPLEGNNKIKKHRKNYYILGLKIIVSTIWLWIL